MAFHVVSDPVEFEAAGRRLAARDDHLKALLAVRKAALSLLHEHEDPTSQDALAQRWAALSSSLHLELSSWINLARAEGLSEAMIGDALVESLGPAISEIFGGGGK